MNTLRLNKVVFFILVTAMLSLQWSSAHIHLAEYHDHDGEHHQHNVQAHAHQSFSPNDNYFDSNHQIDSQNIKVIELGNDCNIHNWNNLDDQCIALTSAHFPHNLTHNFSRVESSANRRSKQRYLDYSTLHLRAPPQIS